MSELARQAAKAVTRDVDGWMQYLTTASRLYKYPFDDQLLIYAQRPDTTACASMELWNRTMRRWIRPGSKGIALIRREGNNPRLEYVFDISDTREVEGARKPALWELKEEHHASVAGALEQRFGPAEEADIALPLMEQARRAAEGIYLDYLSDLIYETEDSLLEGLNPKALEVQFRNLITASVQYTVLLRCGIDPAGYMEEDDLRGITAYSTPMVLHHLGSAVSSVSMELLNEIGRAVRTAERNISVTPPCKRAGDGVY